MLFNLSIIFITAMLFAYLFNKIRLPELLGMIIAGLLFGPIARLIGPPVSLVFTDKIYEFAAEFRTAALIVILIRAGLGINREMLNKIKFSVLKIGFIPCLMEGTTIMIVTHFVLKWSLVHSLLLGFIIAAVSPAVVVPLMLKLKDLGLGKHKEVPTLVLAGASIDDVLALIIFEAVLRIAAGGDTNIVVNVIQVPVSIILGIVSGCLLGLLFVKFFIKFHVRDTRKVLIFMIIAIIYNTLCNSEAVKSYIPIAGLIGIMAIGFVILEKQETVAHRLAAKFKKIWILAELIIFVLIGAQVDVVQAFSSNILFVGLLIIVVGVLARMSGVYLSLMGSELNHKERLFCGLSNIPKATIQAAIGAIPLSMGIEHGNEILSVAVLSIIITAPIGAILIKLSAPALLEPAGNK